MIAVPHPDPISGTSYSAVELSLDDTRVLLLDQRKLPSVVEYHELVTVDDVGTAITDMVVRGAPAIGITAAYGMVLAARSGKPLDEAGRLLKEARPTAVNLAWAVDRMMQAAEAADRDSTAAVLAEAARRIHREDVAACRNMGRLGAERVPDGATVVTHCNTGGLATGGYGTALGVIRAAHESGKRVSVLADETRPYLQGARLTAWELMQLGIDVELIVDSSAGYFFSRGAVTLAIVGADRIAQNGDVANKIGTYTLACLARQHDRPFFVAAPWSTVDRSTPNGSAIIIEERSTMEVTHAGGVRVAPQGARARNPAFDVTPAGLVTAVFTERGVVEPVGVEAIERLGRATQGLSQ